MSMYLEPTTIQRVSGFLARQGMAMRPWSGASEVLAALEEFLALKSDDEAFWGPLAELLEGMQASVRGASAGLATPEAEILTGAQIDRVIEEIRAALPGSVGRCESHGMLTGLAAPALACVLWLGIILGGSVDAQAAQPAEAKGTQSAVVVSQADPTLTLAGFVTGSDLSVGLKAKLLVCLTGFATDERAGLVELFEKMTPEEIAAQLMGMVESERCTPAKKEVVKPPRPRGPERVIEAQPAYKGVSFPVKRVRP